MIPWADALFRRKTAARDEIVWTHIETKVIPKVLKALRRWFGPGRGWHDLEGFVRSAERTAYRRLRAYADATLETMDRYEDFERWLVIVARNKFAMALRRAQVEAKYQTFLRSHRSRWGHGSGTRAIGRRDRRGGCEPLDREPARARGANCFLRQARGQVRSRHRRRARLLNAKGSRDLEKGQGAAVGGGGGEGLSIAKSVKEKDVIAGVAGYNKLNERRRTMSFSEVIVDGTIRPDGTLELDHKPNLSPGRVKVVLRQESELTPPQEGWWPCMQRIRAEREAAGYHFMKEAEMQAHLDWLRDDEERMDRLYREIEQKRAKPVRP